MSSASSKRPPGFSAGQREPRPAANPEDPLSCEEFSSQHCTQCHPSAQLAYLQRSSACQTPLRGSSANLQDLRPARTTSLRQLPTSSASRLARASLGQQTKTPGRASPFTSSQAPNSLASGSIVCNFVNQLRPAKYRPKPRSAARNSRPSASKRYSAPASKILWQETTAPTSSLCQKKRL